MKKLRAPARSAYAALLCASALNLCLGPAWADVGIGTKSPLATLHVAGEAAGVGTDLRVENLDPPQDSDAIQILVADQSGYVHTASIEDLSLELSDALSQGGGGLGGTDDDWRPSQETSDMTIDSAIYTNARIGVNIQTPAYEVDVEGDIRATGSIFASNHVITHATFATSDARFKRDVEPYTQGLEQIRALQPKRFRYSASAPVAQKDRVYYGLIAQEAAKIDPTFVETFRLPSTHKNAQGITEYLGVDSQRLIFTLISAVKELDRKDREIDALKSRLDRLEAHLDAAGLIQRATLAQEASAKPKAQQDTAIVAEPGRVLRPDHSTLLVTKPGTVPTTLASTGYLLSPETFFSNPRGNY